MKRFGLIGFPVGHSFSRTYFQEKFKVLGLNDHVYELYEMEFLKDFPALWERFPDLVGVNVTVPHKENVIRFLDRLDSSASRVEAVNVIKRVQGKLVGYNSDYYGFKVSVENYFQRKDKIRNALILGRGGASKAVEMALLDLWINCKFVSRNAGKGDFTYDDLEKDPGIIEKVDMIINTTPLGTYPNIETKPLIPYDAIQPKHYLYDLVYNPEETAFMKEGRKRGAKTKNGLEMLQLQADRAWEIWTN